MCKVENCLQSLRKSAKWIDIVNSLLKCNTVGIPSLYSEKQVLLTVSTIFLAEKAFSTQDVELYTIYPIVARRAWPAFRPSASREQRYLAYKMWNIGRQQQLSPVH